VPAPVLPGTGSYMVYGYTTTHDSRHAKQLTLVRNPYFRQWSFAVQPAGYPDVIRFEEVDAFKDRVADVLTGRADVTLFGGRAGVRGRPFPRP
jgi:ABC-type transport system substrate-binding protein